jgi:hypothetical protein
VNRFGLPASRGRALTTPQLPDRARVMRRTATGLLVVMAGVFVISGQYLEVHPAWGYVHAFAEAAMVGGLADWFAVTRTVPPPAWPADPAHRDHP